MIVGVAVVEIHVHDSQSLKAKRGVVRSIAGRLRSRFNLSVGEVGGQGTWQRATLGLSMVGSDERIVRAALRKALDFVEETHLAQVVDQDLEILRMPIQAPLADEATGVDFDLDLDLDPDPDPDLGLGADPVPDAENEGEDHGLGVVDEDPLEAEETQDAGTAAWKWQE